MSYVLEALKKQEAQSNPDAAVLLTRAAAEARRQRRWALLFGATMAVNLAVIGWLVVVPLFSDRSELAPSDASAPAEPGRAAAERAGHEPGVLHADRSAAAPPDRNAPLPGAGAEADRVAPASVPTAHAGPEVRAPASPPASAPEQRPAERPSAERPSAERRSAERRVAERRVALRDLPADVRQRFPGLAFSTHIYAEARDLRAVVANGERLREGDSIRGVTVREITEGGVVLAFERYLVEVPIFAQWEED